MINLKKTLEKESLISPVEPVKKIVLVVEEPPSQVYGVVADLSQIAANVTLVQFRQTLYATIKIGLALEKIWSVTGRN